MVAGVVKSVDNVADALAFSRSSIGIERRLSYEFCELAHGAVRLNPE